LSQVKEMRTLPCSLADIEKVKAYRRKMGQTGMILTWDLTTGKLISFKFVYEWEKISKARERGYYNQYSEIR